jgi:hypothetical protein
MFCGKRLRSAANTNCSELKVEVKAAVASERPCAKANKHISLVLTLSLRHNSTTEERPRNDAWTASI